MADVLEFEPLLDKDSLPQIKSLIDKPIPLKAFPSILDYPFSNLVKRDINEVRKVLKEELSHLDNVSNEQKDVCLQKIFTRLFVFQPDTAIVDFNNSETRFYIDLISMPEIYQNKYIREFLDEKYYVSSGDIIDSLKLSFLRRIYDYYDNHSQESIDKMNYILRSSNKVTFELLEDCTIELEDFFSDKIMSSFDKEELSQLFRFYFNPLMIDDLTKLFSDDKSLYMISEMTKIVKEYTGHGSEFLYSIFRVLKQEDNFINILNSFYDEFKDKDLSSLVEVKELINYIVNYSYSFTNIEIDFISDVKSFMDIVSSGREKFHYCVFERGALNRIVDGTFNEVSDFKEINNDNDLELFKRSILSNIYGIDISDAKVLIKSYGKYINELEKCVSKDYKVTLGILKTIKEIVDLDISSPDFKDKLDILRIAYYDFVVDHGFDSKNSIASILILDGLCSKMVMHTYNDRLLNESSCKVIGKDRGVVLLDAGVDFDIILTSTGAVGEFFGDYDNFSNKWNTSHLSENQGLCVSHMTNQNLGVITFSAPFIGFSHIPDEALNTMGPYDIYSNVAAYNLRRANNKLKRLYVPASIMSEETRFGYNELLIDRFLMNDKDDNLKLQPSYVIFFKVGKTEDNRTIYNQCLKIAKDLNVPIVVVDVPKIKRHEKEEIEKQEEELFRSDCPDLIKPILTRYMNNYTGALSLTGAEYGGYEDDFSIPGMNSFFEKLIKKINSIDDDKIRLEWMEAIVDVYNIEKDKYDAARTILLSEYSVGSFILDDLGLGKVVTDIKKGEDRLSFKGILYSSRKNVMLDEVNLEDIIYGDPELCPEINMSDGKPGVFFSESNCTPYLDFVVNFVNLMEVGSSFTVEDNAICNSTNGKNVCLESTKDKDILLIENMALSYFLEDFSIIPTFELQGLSLTKQSHFGRGAHFDFIEGIKNSEYSFIIKNNLDMFKTDKIDRYIERLESIEDDSFIHVFKPFIDNLVMNGNGTFEELSLKLLDKKHNMRDNFNKLKNIYTDTDMKDIGKGKR